MEFGTPARVAFLLFAVSFGVYLAGSVRLQTDSVWVVHTARSLVAHQDAFAQSYIDRHRSIVVESKLTSLFLKRNLRFPLTFEATFSYKP